MGLYLLSVSSSSSRVYLLVIREVIETWNQEEMKTQSSKYLASYLRGSFMITFIKPINFFQKLFILFGKLVNSLKKIAFKTSLTTNVFGVRLILIHKLYFFYNQPNEATSSNPFAKLPIRT